MFREKGVTLNTMKSDSRISIYRIRQPEIGFNDFSVFVIIVIEISRVFVRPHDLFCQPCFSHLSGANNKDHLFLKVFQYIIFIFSVHLCDNT